MPAIQSDSLRSRACTVPVAIYSRVSTANQVGGRFDSCESQAAVCRDFIANTPPAAGSKSPASPTRPTRAVR